MIFVGYLLQFLNYPDPKYGYEVLFLTEDTFTPINIVLIYCAVVIAGPILEEIIFRRITIPFLEERGMSPLSAVFATSVAFCIGHIPNDLINGNSTGLTIYLIVTFGAGITLGIVYIYTRNTFYPIMIHGMFNFIGVSHHIIELSGKIDIMIIYFSLGLIIYGIGILSLLLLIWKYLKYPDSQYFEFLRQKAQNFDYVD